MTYLSEVREFTWSQYADGRWQVNVRHTDHDITTYTVGVDADVWVACRMAFRVRQAYLTEEQKQEIITMAEQKLNKDGTPRKPRASNKKASSADVVEIVSSLSNHLRFVSFVYEDKAEPYARHCVLNSNTLCAFNGVIAAGVRIDENVTAAPDLMQLKRAIERAGSQYAMTIDANFLTIKAGKFRVSIPTLDQRDMPAIVPDACQWPLDNKIKDALKAASAFTNDNAPTVLVASVLLTNGTVVGTDRFVLVEYWHGNAMPEVAVPKEFATAIIKCDKEIVGFGYTEGVSITFWFADGSFIKTQLYSEGWPASWRNALFDTLRNQRELPEIFWEAYDAIAGFSADDVIRFGNEIAHSHKHLKDGATYEMKDQSFGWAINIRRLKMIRPYVKQIGTVREGVLGFVGDNVRGIISLFAEELERAPAPSPAPLQSDAIQSVTPAHPGTQTEESPTDFVSSAQPGIAEAYEQAMQTGQFSFAPVDPEPDPASDGWGAR